MRRGCLYLLTGFDTIETLNRARDGGGGGGDGDGEVKHILD